VEEKETGTPTSSLPMLQFIRYVWLEYGLEIAGIEREKRE